MAETKQQSPNATMMGGVGEDKATQTGVEAWDKAHGTYKAPEPDLSNTAAGAMPKGSDPSPFSLGSVGGK